MSAQLSEYLKIVKWADVEADVRNALPHLHEIIAQLDPGENLKLVRARYPFGARIFHGGMLYLPNSDNSSVPFGHPALPKELIPLLNYSCLPLGVNLNKCIEGYKDLGSSIHPFVIMEPDLSIGTWEYLAGQYLLNESNATTSNISLSAGARSIFMLPKITDNLCHKRLKKTFGIKAFPPRNYLDHASLFAELINGKQSKTQWHCDVLFFTKEWNDNIINDTRWANLNAYIIHRAWNQSKAGRMMPLIDSIWFEFLQSVLKSGRKINIYLLDTVQRLFYIALGVLPAMTPNCPDDRVAPIENIQKIYLDEYKLKKYFPTVMTPAIFDIRSAKPPPVYYSLQMPTVISSSFYNPYSVMDDLVELKELMRIFSRVLEKTDLVIEGVPLAKLPKLVNVEYFHTETYSTHGILPTNDMITGDPNLIGLNEESAPDRQFSDKSHFVKGCVRIKKL
jgi:hypothetical protein